MGHNMPPVRTFTELRMFKPWVPHSVRFWLLMVFILFFQFTGGVYLASITQIQGELAFITEDVTMASYCSLIGLNMIFPVLFRWKFFFYTRQMWFVASIGSLICAILAYYVNMPWLFCTVGLFAGYFKMMGMFACVSNVQLNWTPTRNFGVFLPIIYLFVLGAIRLSDITATWVQYYSNWKLMYCVIVVMMLFIDAVVYFMMKHDHRCAPFVPLKGVDWTGHILWTITCVAGAYIFTYGEHYEWWTNQKIWNATWLFIIMLLISVLWMLHKRDKAFIVKDAFKFPMTYALWIILFAVTLISGIAHYVQPIYIGGVLGYDSINAIDLNYPQLMGIVLGCILSFYCIIKLKWSLRQYFFLNAIFFLFYCATMYFAATPGTPKVYLFVPAFILAVGEIMMETGATYALSQHIPWPYFFMNITIIGFVRCGLGSSAGAAIIERGFSRFSIEYGVIDAIRECYGVGALICIGMIILVLLSNFKSAPLKLVPRIISVYRMLKHPQH